MYKDLLDSHFHILAMKEKGIDVDALLTELFESGFHGGIDIAVDADDLKHRLEYRARFPKVKLSLGVGPWGLESGNKPVAEQLSILESYIKTNKNDISFIGEIGLDNHYDTYGTKKEQEEFFISQIELANTYGFPIIVHSREAVQQTVDVLKNHKAKYGGIIHCFSANEYLLTETLKLGFYISLAGPVTYKNSTALEAIIPHIPLERLLLETDSPYLPPVPLRGTVNTPKNMPLIYKRVSDILCIPYETLVQRVKDNFDTLSKNAEV